MVVTFLFQKILQLKDCRHWPCVATYNIYMNCVRDVNHLCLEKQNYCNVSAVTLVPYQLEKQNYCNVREVTLALFRIVAAIRLAFTLVVAHKYARWPVRLTTGWHQCTQIARPYVIWLVRMGPIWVLYWQARIYPTLGPYGIAIWASHGSIMGVPLWAWPYGTYMGGLVRMGPIWACP